MMAEPILYSFRRCPYAMRGRMGLQISGVAHEIREIILRDKPHAMLDASPKGTVPVLVLPDGEVIDESIDVLRWALAQNDPENWLAGDDAALIARNDNDASEGGFKYHLDRYKYATRYDVDALTHRAAGLVILEDLNARLAKQTFLCGESRSLTDIAIFPFIRQFANSDREWFDALPLTHLQQWLAGLLSSDLFQQAMVKRDLWQAETV